ncbi:unnamed protein product [Urochloa decumbens]|uniref:Uncharacterized protein n=1 Tax=Urochloa decumbens TaxID=240449 RepID=A0ABC8VBK5_9POAL
MTAAAANADPVIGRDDEIDRVVCTLCRRTKNSAVLLGEPGVGKTAIAKGLAQRIAAGAVPEAIAGARVVEIDIGAMLAGTMYRGMFEERVKGVIREAEDAGGKVILFIDEMHMLLGAGRVEGGNMDAANMLKPALARGRIRCIGATTFDEYRKYIEKDAAFERRLQKVHVEEPSANATIGILRGLKQRYEDHHGLRILDDAIVAAANLAGRYITVLMVLKVVSRWTGIPVTTLDQEEKKKLIGLADRLHERVIGQDEAVNLVAQAVLRSRAGLDKRRQPIGSFLFLGSTGVGKTELAKALAEQLFDSEKMLLTEKVSRRPYSVILFDEVEKADPAVFNVFLQLLDDGLLTDGKGRAVDFKNTIIILTSNLGAEHLAEAMAGNRTMEAARDLVRAKVQQHFKPEFLNRLSEIVIFEPLSHDMLKEVVKIQMKGIIAGVADKGISLSTSDDALDVILSESYNPMCGARPIGRWVQKNVITKLSDMLIKGEVDAGSTISIEAIDDKKTLKYEVTKKPEPQKSEVVAPEGERIVVEVLSDSEDDEDGVVEVAPVAKKSKVTESSAAPVS